MGISTWREEFATSLRDRRFFFAAKLFTSLALATTTDGSSGQLTEYQNLSKTHIETVKKTDIVIIATQSNNEPIAVWVEALIKSKAKIERLVKRTLKSGERPCCARISKNGDISVDENYRNRSTTRKRPREGQE